MASWNRQAVQFRRDRHAFDSFPLGRETPGGSPVSTARPVFAAGILRAFPFLLPGNRYDGRCGPHFWLEAIRLDRRDVRNTLALVAKIFARRELAAPAVAGREDFTASRAPIAAPKREFARAAAQIRQSV